MNKKPLYLGVSILAGLVLFARIDRSDPGDKQLDPVVKPVHNAAPIRPLAKRPPPARRGDPTAVPGYATSPADGAEAGSPSTTPERRGELRRSAAPELDEETADLLDDLHRAADAETKVLVIGRLASSMSIPEVTGAMLQLANDPDEEVRSTLLRLFPVMHGPDVMPALARMAREDPSEAIRERADQLNAELSLYRSPPP